MSEKQKSIFKPEILANICYTELVYGRINKKLTSQFSIIEIEKMIHTIIEETEEKFFNKMGKNIYVTNVKHNIILTINLFTSRIITVDKIDKSIKFI